MTMKKTTLFLLIIFISLISSAQVKEAVPKQQFANPAPFVIPALREWKSWKATGTCLPMVNQLPRCKRCFSHYSSSAIKPTPLMVY